MKARNIGYWVTTVLLGLAFLAGGAGDLSHSPQVVEGLVHLGYPVYFGTLLGVWKVLAAVAILAPRFPRLKEWAYAGICFDLTSASYSHVMSGDPASNVITPMAILAVAAASWALRPESRRLADAAAQPAPAALPAKAA